MKLQRPLIVLFCMVFPLWCAAVQPYVPVKADPVLEPWRWRVETALNDLGVLCMDEAADGSLWFGCVGSLAHYDGMNVTRIPFEEGLLSKISHQSPNPWANALLILPDGSVLALIGESLVLRRNAEWTVVVQDVGESVFSAKLVRGSDDTIWLGVPGGVWRIAGDLTQAEQVLKAASVWGVLSFCLDRSGCLWAIEKTGPERSRLIQMPAAADPVNPQSGRVEFPVPFQNESSEAALFAKDDGLIWYADGSKHSGLEAFDVKLRKWVDCAGMAPDLSYYSLLERKDRSLWAGAAGRFVRLTADGGSHTFYTYEQILLPKKPFQLFETRNQRLWMIGRIGHVYSVDMSESEWFTYKGLNFDVETADGVQWFRYAVDSSCRSVVRHDPRTGEWLQYTTEDGLPDRVLRIMHSSHGLIWAAGEYKHRAAFSVFDGETWTRFEHPEFAEWIEPKSVMEAADGTVWFGAGGALLADQSRAGGALRYAVTDRGEVRLMKHHSPPGFPYYVTALAQTSDGTLWVGSTLLHAVDGKTLKAVPIQELQGENTMQMTLDKQGDLWVLKEHFGVCRKTENSWKVFSIRDGLSSLLLSSLICLDDGSILVASSEGLNRFDGQTWAKVPGSDWFGMATRFSGLNQSCDGSIWMNFDFNERRSLRVRVNDIGGVCAVRFRPETNPPDTRIEGYLKQVAQPGNTHIAWSGNDLWSSTPAEYLQYSWRLNGGEWSAFSKDTSKTFLNLASGTHRLEVRARDQVFNVDQTPARAEFKVIPPVWMQPWFISLIAGLLASIVFLLRLLMVFREKNLKERQADREALLISQQEEREKNLMEQQAAREAHLQEIDRLKTGFFTNISHELRTPMTVVVGRLEKSLSADCDTVDKESLAITLRNAQRVSGLITQLLDFRKIEEGRIKVDPVYGDLVPALKDWVSSLQVLADKKQIGCKLESLESCRGRFDFDKLQKIFTNLIANAIKYTESGGEVRIALGNDADCGGEQRLRFTVEDTGQGIPPEHIRSVFERFYRVPKASMAVGAGIGLNLTKELVELLGGEIQVESPIHPDAMRPGSRFTVRLPIEQVARGEGQGASVESASSDPSDLPDPSDPVDRLNPPSSDESPLILIVEDDEDIREFIIDGLSSGYRVETAENGESGLRLAKELIPDLIITDLMMPVMDGVALCRELKTSMETSHIPVVMLTAKTALESQLEGLKTGADDYITKPFHMELLRVRIANLLESRRILREKFCSEHPVLTPKMIENAPDAEFMQKCLSALEANGSQGEFDPDGFAGVMNMSLSSLYRKLRAVAGKTPAEFIREYRMMRGAELLSSTTLSVTDIAFQVGCDDSSHFSRMFKTQYKMSPKQYRAGHPVARNTP